MSDVNILKMRAIAAADLRKQKEYALAALKLNTMLIEAGIVSEVVVDQIHAGHADGGHLARYDLDGVAFLPSSVSEYQEDRHVTREALQARLICTREGCTRAPYFGARVNEVTHPSDLLPLFKVEGFECDLRDHHGKTPEQLAEVGIRIDDDLDELPW